ncbi:MFS transporter [Sphingopyxis lindanitolerans]|uniref:MFS transporter n=1 Tax=Sphingopyxis lindanitolerans TaxID=2054227 RepID=A0A2S8BB94_9SPHN|nr:MFS transporter [Sphingopyxis lindanitolerans]PQM29628.1 MFS transporter [Sphingopyxis lindanitolerans]
MIDRLNRLLRVEPGEGPKLAQFALFGFLLQMGLGIGFSAGDAAFFSHVGVDALPVIFMLTPAVMLVYTGLFSVLMVRFSLNHMVMATLALLVAGGVILWALLSNAGDSAPLYYVLKLYLAMWYIALYSLFWNFTDAYFDIQDAKRLFPLFAAFCALGTAVGALIVNLLAAFVPLPGFLLLWAGVALATMPLAWSLGRRWPQLSESDADDSERPAGIAAQLAVLANSFRTSRYTLALTATLFVTLLMTNLAEYQYAAVLQQGRSEAQLAALFGALYAASNIFNLLVCLFVFNRLVTRLGVRNVAFILPLTYFAVFGFFFLSSGYIAAIAAFFAYHGVLTSIEYNNQNLLFNAVPSAIKRPLRTVIEGMCEPLASLIAGAFLLYAAKYLDLRELSGIGVILGALLIATVVLLRQLYPSAMAGNMRQGWLNFGAPLPALAPGAEARLRTLAASPGAPLLDLRGGSDQLRLADPDAIADLLAAAPRQSPRERRQSAALIADFGETAIPHLVAALRDTRRAQGERAVAARALASLSQAQFAAQSDAIVAAESDAARQAMDSARRLDAAQGASGFTGLLARAQRERASAAVDFLLELLALRGLLPDFDLLIVSLHSANAKVRANAMEAVETGIGHALFRGVEAVLQPRKQESIAPPSDDEVTRLAEAALENGAPVEVAVALALLHQRLSPSAFARRTAPLIHAAMPPALRAQLLALLALRHEDGPSRVALIDALRQTPNFAAATLEALASLAEMARTDSPTAGWSGATASGERFWIAHEDIRAAAARHPDLALVMLRVQDGRDHAA